MYIVDHARQILLIKEMKRLRKDTHHYEVYYHHPFTDQIWKSFFPLAGNDDLGPKLLRHDPVTKGIKERLQICLTEDDPENAIGLGIEWSAQSSIWAAIIDVLEKEYTHFDRNQLKLFLEHLDLKEGRGFKSNVETEDKAVVSDEKISNLIWRTRKIRMKRFFILG